MLNVRLANTPLFCTDDISAIIESLSFQVSAIMSETGNGVLSANQLGTAFFEQVESYLQSAVDDMQEMRS